MIKKIVHSKPTKYLKKHLPTLENLWRKNIIPYVQIIDEKTFSTTFMPSDSIPNYDVVDISRTQRLFNVFQEKQEDWYEHLDRANSFLNSLGYLLPNPDFSQHGLIHGDLNTNNIVVSGGKPVFIDLEHVKNGPLAYDLARPLLRFAKNRREEYLEAYFGTDTQLSKDELKEGELFFYAIQAYERNRLLLFNDVKQSIALLEKYL